MPNAVSHWQILSADPERTARFYTQLFGWTIDASNAIGYREVRTGAAGGIDGGIWPAPPGAPTFVQLFIDVEDLAAAVARATELGASVLFGPQKLPDGDEMALLRDPEGLAFGLARRARR
ncbi:MAG: VOC family protein [Thermoanaerobaculia bacterium]